MDPNDYNNIQFYQVKKADFNLMITAVNNYITKNKRNPNLVYLRKDGTVLVQYVSYKKYLEMLSRWKAFIATTKLQPAYINI